MYELIIFINNESIVPISPILGRYVMTALRFGGHCSEESLELR